MKLMALLIALIHSFNILAALPSKSALGLNELRPFNPKVKATWKEVKGGKDVQVFAGEVEGSDLVAFKGIGIIDAPLKNVASVLLEMDRKKEWIHNLKEAKILKKVSETERIEYSLTGAPWPVSDRDFVYSARLWHSSDLKEVKFILSAVNEPLGPLKEGVVRGELHESVYHLYDLGNNQTRIEVEIFADPKGSVPKWVVNLFQRLWPINTISGIRKELTREDFKLNPEIVSYFERHQKLKNL